jgi:hypothetical protein
MYSLLNKVKNLCLSLDIQFELRDALVKPMLLFGSDLWGLQNMESVFTVRYGNSKPFQALGG